MVNSYGDIISPGFPVLFLPGNLTLLPTIQGPERCWFSGYHLSAVPSSEGSLKILQVGYFDACAPDVEGEGEGDHSELTDGLD